MKKLFINQPLFRLFSPIVNGFIVYMLVLLINNNVTQLQEEFLGEELYVFIGLSVLTQEAFRLILLSLNKNKTHAFSGAKVLFQVALTLLASISIVSTSMYLFYEFIEGYTINFDELLVFNSIFAVMSFIYVALFISNQYLYRVNSEKLSHENLVKKNIEDEFLKFKRELNPNLFFDCLEQVLILIEEDKEQIEELVDHLSLLYRYILNKKEKQLVEIKEELDISNQLVTLLGMLSVRPIKIQSNVSSGFYIVPGAILNIVELISRTSVPIKHPLEIEITENDGLLIIKYIPNDKIKTDFKDFNLESLKQVYSIYSDHKISVTEEKQERHISIPKLILQ